MFPILAGDWVRVNLRGANSRRVEECWLDGIYNGSVGRVIETTEQRVNVQFRNGVIAVMQPVELIAITSLDGVYDQR